MIFLVAIIICWCNYTIRIINHSRDRVFWKMPWSFLWASAYILGWFYTLNHYFILDYLDNVILSSLNFPITGLVFVSLIVVYTVSSLHVLKDKFNTSFTTAKGIIGLIYVISALNHFREQDYMMLYWQNSITVYVIILVASFSLYSTSWKHPQYPADNLELAHTTWYSIFAMFFGIANLLIAINGVRGILGYIDTPEITLQYVAYACNLIGMFAINIMVLPDDILFRTIYPVRVWQCRRLRALSRHIRQHIKDKKYFIPHNDNEKLLDTRTHQILIDILDDYPYLEKDIPLRDRLWQIEQSTKNREELLWQILQINPEKI